MAQVTEITGLSGSVGALAYSPDGKTIAAADNGFDLTLWDTATGKTKGKMTGLFSGSTHLAWSPDSKLVYGTSGNEWIAWEAANGTEKKRIRGEMNRTAPSYIALSANGKMLAAIGRGALKIWDSASASVLGEYEVHANYGINGAAFSPDGKTIATAGTDRTAQLTDVSDGAPLMTFKCGNRVSAVEFSPNGKTLFVTDQSGILHQFDVASGEDHPAPGLPREPKQLAVSPDGKFVACSGASLHLWMVAENRWQTERITDSSMGATAVAFSPDGKTIAYGLAEGKIRFALVKTISAAK